jgi:radical SAM protein with 4Fe4S-binding SPASM domain
MDLIIKPTDICDFACTFCSSPTLAKDKKTLLGLGKIDQFLNRFPETNTIIVNGGEPLMVSPDYYWKIIDSLDEKKMKTSISITSNLWDFYKKPEKWIALFKHPRVNISTSFNYGNGRRISKSRVYTEEIFLKVMEKFKFELGYFPDFISVITDEDEHMAVNNVRLAKSLNIECKLNYSMASGRESKPYQLSKIYRTYLEIIDLGLSNWEFNSKELIKTIKNKATVCPRNRSCDSGIRCLQPDGDYYSCGAFGDDKEFPIDFDKEMAGGFVTPLKNESKIFSMKNDCLTCSLFDICNGCKKTINDHKNHNMVEEHCSLMKTLEPQIINLTKRETSEENFCFS